MFSISQLQKITDPIGPLAKEKIRVQISPTISSPDEVVRNIASIDGAVDVYCWFEGPINLPNSGAQFMKESIFEPLFKQKKEAKIYLYSLKAWNFEKNVAAMRTSTPLGDAINRINTAAIECIYASSFFRYCSQASTKSGLYDFLQQELPKKQWLIELSAKRKKMGQKVDTLFNNQQSFFDSIKTFDVRSAYSLMQYVEGYYLIQESVKRGLLKGQNPLEIAFVLPNDESKFFTDFPRDIAKMLELDFGKSLEGIDVNIRFQFFQYGESLDSRPYIDKRRHAPQVEPEEIIPYFDFLSENQGSELSENKFFLRDAIHNLNGGV